MFLKEKILEIAELKIKKSKKSKKMEKLEKCPLCCENMELDDMNFLPCPCGYKVCLFCWNRIKTSETDPKCPLCRRTYTENPAKFEPLSADELLKLKNKKKQEDVKKKQKLAEDRKQLADIRVVRKNLIFVNELPMNFSKDPKVYQKFVSIFKQAGSVKKFSVLNSSKNYAGQKAPFARAYITYVKNEDALKALKMFENVEFEGKELKLSLGTTKYCSNYVKNVNCTNKECVYLHEHAEPEASFTKDQIHLGKHIEYGQKLYEQYVNNLQSRSLSNSVSEEKKLDSQPQQSEEKEIISENSPPASTSQHNSLPTLNERSSSPVENDSNSVTVFQQLQKILKAANITESSSRNCDVINFSFDERDVLHKFMSLNSPVNNSSNSSIDLGSENNSANTEVAEISFKERFELQREPQTNVIPNGNPFHDERFSAKESLLTRLNLMNSHQENNSIPSENYRKPFTKDLGAMTFSNADLQDPPDCDLDFDPIKLALGGLGDLVISEKQKSRIEVNSLNTTPINAYKKINSNPQQRVQQQVNSPNNFLPLYQNRSQNSPGVDFYNQTSFRPAVQSPASVGRSSIHSQTSVNTTQHQRSQVPPFANALTIQLPRFSPGMSVGGSNTMVNGYSPQQFIPPQISPEAFVLSQQLQQQNQNFDSFSQPQFSSFEQIPPSQVYSINSLQNQSMREYGGNMSLNQRIRNEALSRHQSFPMQQQYQQLQRLNSYCNTTPQGGNLPYDH